jgi:hypothetical protein
MDVGTSQGDRAPSGLQLAQRNNLDVSANFSETSATSKQ